MTLVRELTAVTGSTVIRVMRLAPVTIVVRKW